MSTFIIVSIVVVILVGLFFLIQAMRSKTYKGDDKSLEYKNGLPISPRGERVSEDIRLDQDNDNVINIITDDGDDALSRLAKAAEESNSQKTAKNESPNREGKDVLTSVNHNFEQQSPLLDRHLNKEETFDQNNSPLLHALDTVTFFITPRNRTIGLSGKEILDIAKSYGLRFGVMNMYHRYEHEEEGTGDLWFSMLGIGRDGVQEFDVNTLYEQRFSGLSLFLSLPHPHAQRCYKAMVYTADLIAKDLNADIHDEHGYVFKAEDFEKLGLQVANYQPNHQS